MNIAINGFDLNKKDLFSAYKHWLVITISQQLPQHHFFFITDQEIKDTQLTNLTYLTIQPINNQGLKKILWQKIKLPALIKKHQIDTLLSFDNLQFFNKNTQNFLLSTVPLNDKKFNISVFKKIGLLSYNSSKKSVQTNQTTLFQGLVLPEYRSLSFDQKSAIIHQIADGKEYFIFSNWTNNKNEIIHILKAFSIFKKKQTSTWKLLILVQNPQLEQEVQALLKNYKYKSDIIVKQTDNHQQTAEIIAAAYCYITTNNIQTDILLHQVFKTGVPIIAPNENHLHEVFNKAYISFDENDINEIAQKIIYIYKDENLGNSYIGKSLQEANLYNNNAILEQLCNWMK